MGGLYMFASLSTLGATHNFKPGSSNGTTQNSTTNITNPMVTTRSISQIRLSVENQNPIHIDFKPPIQQMGPADTAAQRIVVQLKNAARAGSVPRVDIAQLTEHLTAYLANNPNQSLNNLSTSVKGNKIKIAVGNFRYYAITEGRDHYEGQFRKTESGKSKTLVFVKHENLDGAFKRVGTFGLVTDAGSKSVLLDGRIEYRTGLILEGKFKYDPKPQQMVLTAGKMIYPDGTGVEGSFETDEKNVTRLEIGTVTFPGAKGVLRGRFVHSGLKGRLSDGSMINKSGTVVISNQQRVM
ncbi:hypothetical protein EBR57_00740 [bacterium]|nr:hypothetical protein [bacterium]